jgi:co-chaperonin GroES (HSP10)
MQAASLVAWHTSLSNGATLKGELLMKAFRPLEDRVLVRRIAAEERTPGGLIIPDTAKEKPVEGEVLAVGQGVRDETGRLIPLEVKVGDHVLLASGRAPRW